MEFKDIKPVSEEPSTIEVIRELKKDDYLRIALYNYVNPKSEEMIVHAVNVMEDLLSPELENDEEWEKEKTKIVEQINKTFGNPRNPDPRMHRLRMITEARLRFRVLWKKIEKKIPEEVVGYL